MITIELNLYPEKHHISNYQQNTQTLYTEEDIKNLHQLAIDKNLKINTLLQNKKTKTYSIIIAYVSNPILIHSMNDEPSFIKCQYVSNNGELGDIIKFSYTISELLKDFSIVEKED